MKRLEKWDRDLAEADRQCVAPAIPPDETLLSASSLLREADLPYPPRRLRPTVYEGHRNRCGPVLRFFDLVSRLLDMDFGGGITTGAPEKREEYKRKKMALFGDWDSLAGTLTRSLHPRSRVTIKSYMAVTDRNLYVIWTESLPPRRGEPLPPVIGWSTSRENLHWVRHRKDQTNDTYELGFTDGSWARMTFLGSRVALTTMFPNPLHYKDPVP